MTAADAADTNTEALLRIQTQLEQLCEGMDAHLHQPPQVSTADLAELERMRSRVTELESQLADLEQQNEDLASQVACSSARQAVNDDESVNETLSWEQRKEIILKQMEEETFDAEAFVLSWTDEPGGKMAEQETPMEYVRRLNDELARRDREIGELRHLLEQQTQTNESGVTIGAAAIAEMIDSDELVQEQRDRLLQLQAEWEDKFRQSEIEASLERAKLSRERRELAAKRTELERELEAVRLRAKQVREKDAPRKWLSQLGLTPS